MDSAAMAASANERVMERIRRTPSLAGDLPASPT
jgi:hypothetical protein